MKTLPTIDPAEPIVNQALAPYFKELTEEIRSMTEHQRHMRLGEYKRYIEGQAQKTKSLTLRIQLRINLQALLELFDYNGVQAEITVKPKKQPVRVYDGELCRYGFDEELAPMRIIQ